MRKRADSGASRDRDGSFRQCLGVSSPVARHGWTDQKGGGGGRALRSDDDQGGDQFAGSDEGGAIANLSRMPQERRLDALRLSRYGRIRAQNTTFRLGPDDHARLAEAARLYGMRPNVLARVVTVRGVDRALREAASAR